MISNLERGNKAIKIENLVKLCDILDVSTDYILKGEHGNTDRGKTFLKFLNLNEHDYKMIEMLINFCVDET